MGMPFNTRRIVLFCIISLVSLLCVAKVQAQEDLPQAPKKKSDKIDFLYRASLPVLGAATSVDAFTTVRNLNHPTTAFRADGTFLMDYYVVENGWARYFGDRSPFAATTANVLLNAGVIQLSHRLYLRGGRWRIAAAALVLAKAGVNFAGGIQNERYSESIDQRVRLSTGYKGAVLWSSPQRSH